MTIHFSKGIEGKNDRLAAKSCTAKGAGERTRADVCHLPAALLRPCDHLISSEALFHFTLSRTSTDRVVVLVARHRSLVEAVVARSSLLTTQPRYHTALIPTNCVHSHCFLSGESTESSSCVLRWSLMDALKSFRFTKSCSVLVAMTKNSGSGFVSPTTTTTPCSTFHSVCNGRRLSRGFGGRSRGRRLRIPQVRKRGAQGELSVEKNEISTIKQQGQGFKRRRWRARCLPCWLDLPCMLVFLSVLGHPASSLSLSSFPRAALVLVACCALSLPLPPEMLFVFVLISILYGV